MNPRIDAHFRYGKRLHLAGRLTDAGQVYQQVLAATPMHPEALDMMGVLYLQTGQPAQSLPWFERAIAARGSVADFHIHHAQALLALERAEESAAASRAAIRLKRGLAEAHQALGRALIATGAYEAALKAFQDAVRLKPDLMDGLNDLGIALNHVNRPEEAARTLARAAAKEPREPSILINLSNALKSLGRFDEAEARLTAALRLDPNDPRTLYNYSLLLLLLGRFEAAWPGWEQRFRAGAVAARGLPQPVWRGEPLAGRTLLIHAEQGLGDTIQFCRFPFPSDGPVLLEVPARVARLIGSRRSGHRIVKAGDPLPHIDLTCPLMSLPAILGTADTNRREDRSSPNSLSLGLSRGPDQHRPETGPRDESGDGGEQAMAAASLSDARYEATIPHEVPYLFAEPDLVARWRDRLGQTGFRVGIAWQGNPTRHEDQGRSIALSHYLPLAQVPGVRLISLQKDDGAEQAAGLTAVEMPGADFDAGPDGFIDTAAVMMNLDLIITSDTAIAHLAGALGRPVWVALRAVPDWRWLLDRPDSPWYPTMRLFRQTVRDDWPPVFAAIRDALAKRVEATHD